MSDGIDPFDAAREMLQHYIEQEHGFLSWLNVSIDEMTQDSLTMTVPYDEKLLNKPPSWMDASVEDASMHGGIAATLVDTAGGLALRPSLDDPIAGGVATINLNVNYLRGASSDMTAYAEVVRAGGSVGVSQILVESETPDGQVKPVAVGMGAYRLFQGGD